MMNRKKIRKLKANFSKCFGVKYKLSLKSYMPILIFCFAEWKFADSIISAPAIFPIQELYVDKIGCA